MNWTVQEYVAELRRRNNRCRGRNEALEAVMMELFPPDEEELVADPCVVVDSEGTILMWYLPSSIQLPENNLVEISGVAVKCLLRK